MPKTKIRIYKSLRRLFIESGYIAEGSECIFRLQRSREVQNHGFINETPSQFLGEAVRAFLFLVKDAVFLKDYHCTFLQLLLLFSISFSFFHEWHQGLIWYNRICCSGECSMGVSWFLLTFIVGQSSHLLPSAMVYVDLVLRIPSLVKLTWYCMIFKHTVFVQCSHRPRVPSLLNCIQPVMWTPIQGRPCVLRGCSNCGSGSRVTFNPWQHEKVGLLSCLDPHWDLMVRDDWRIPDSWGGTLKINTLNKLNR